MRLHNGAGPLSSDHPAIHNLRVELGALHFTVLEQICGEPNKRRPPTPIDIRAFLESLRLTPA